MKFEIYEKDMSTVRIDVKIPQINLEILSENMIGNFTKPEVPNQYAIIVPQLENQKLIFTKNKVYSMMKPSIWNRIKDDFRQFLEDIEWEKFAREDLHGIRTDMKRLRRGLE